MNTEQVTDNYILIKEVWGIPYYYNRNCWEGIINNAEKIPFWQVTQIVSKKENKYGIEYKLQIVN